MKIFHELNKNEQDDIRRLYKNKCNKDYKYSIHLYILYVVLGIVALIGLVLCFYNLFLGVLIFTLSFIFMIVIIYFLNISNDKFYKYLKSIGYVYDKKKKR